ncbi:hypothetical protein Q8A64_16645 [Oxalobacteraceae bacterium R-40]|uniref:Uncharacterized protein n=1 Tax=Keguizhuia sedimenti TaxID=3064264 RepID=A0ABU1BUR6_9BURK|nr:hypothetical protein [Oxalobacteraceae bacterium R-40]
MMKIFYKTYLEFVLKADLLGRELDLTAQQAAELLARLSGYKNHATMPIGDDSASLPSRGVLIERLIELRPDISAKRAHEIIDRMHFTDSTNRASAQQKD